MYKELPDLFKKLDSIKNFRQYHSSEDDILHKRKDILLNKKDMLLGTISDVIDLLHEYETNDNSTTNTKNNFLTKLNYIYDGIDTYDDISTINQDIIDIIIKYIGDENGIYKDIDERFWKLVKTSHKLKRNVGDIVINNFDPNIYKQYHEYDFDYDFIGQIITTHELTPQNATYMNDFIDIIYGAALMDVYILGRMFKHFIPKSSDDIQNEYANNIIIITGNIHTRNYLSFLKKINSTVIYESMDVDDYDTFEEHPYKRCVAFHPIKFA